MLQTNLDYMNFFIVCILYSSSLVMSVSYVGYFHAVRMNRIRSENKMKFNCVLFNVYLVLLSSLCKNVCRLVQPNQTLFVICFVSLTPFLFKISFFFVIDQCVLRLSNAISGIRLFNIDDISNRLSSNTIA